MLQPEIDGVQVVTFGELIELKLASGMTAHTTEGFADVQELIRYSAATARICRGDLTPT